MSADRRLGVRLGLAAVLAAVLLVPVALLGALVTGEWAPLHDLDAAITDGLHTWALSHHGMVDAMVVCSWVFSPTSLRVAALALVIWLFRRHANRLAWWVIATMTAGGVIAAVLKLLIERDRPDLLDPVARATGYSFPSGHAANAALTCAVFLLVLLPYRRARPVLWAGAVLIPLVTGVSRIGLGVHWTSDVVAGWLLGIAVVFATAVAFESTRGRVRRAPVPAEGLEPDVAGRLGGD
jgi:membrane-associated phospholipid phosphatase